MQRSFPETLSALRRDKNISQRKAAADLNISQALLSHYENGARAGARLRVPRMRLLRGQRRLSAVQDGQAEHRFQHRSGGESLS